MFKEFMYWTGIVYWLLFAVVMIFGAIASIRNTIAMNKMRGRLEIYDGEWKGYRDVRSETIGEDETCESGTDESENGTDIC